MQRQRLGQTDIKISPIGLGTVKFGRTEGLKYPTGFDLPTDDELRELLAEAKALGINLIDTAPAYGTSEERLGDLLQGTRHDWVISTKVGEEFMHGYSHFDFSAAHINKSIERSLKRLKTDFLDIVLVHSNGEDVKLIEEDQVFHTLSLLKQAGKIRSFGMSTKTVAGGLMSAQLADVTMVTYNPLHTEEKEVIQAAHQLNTGVLIKKGLVSGHLDKIAGKDPIAQALQFVFMRPGVTSLIAGTINTLHLQQLVVKYSLIMRLQKEYRRQLH